MTEELLEKAGELSYKIKRLTDKIEGLSKTKKVEATFAVNGVHYAFELEEEAVGVLISYYSGVLARLMQEFKDLK